MRTTHLHTESAVGRPLSKTIRPVFSLRNTSEIPSTVGFNKQWQSTARSFGLSIKPTVLCLFLSQGQLFPKQNKQKVTAAVAHQPVPLLPWQFVLQSMLLLCRFFYAPVVPRSRAAAGSHSTAEKHRVGRALLGGLRAGDLGGGAKTETDSRAGRGRGSRGPPAQYATWKRPELKY